VHLILQPLLFREVEQDWVYIVAAVEIAQKTVTKIDNIDTAA
jgi:hypothetical protein